MKKYFIYSETSEENATVEVVSENMLTNRHKDLLYYQLIKAFTDSPPVVRERFAKNLTTIPQIIDVNGSAEAS